MRFLAWSPLVALGIASCLIVGCGEPAVENSPEVYENNALSEVRDMYELYTQTKHKAPKSLKDFQAMFSEGNPTGIYAIKSGAVVVIWDVALNENRDADSPDEVLAFVSDVPEKGGIVLMKNRSLKKMTAEEFSAAPKAGAIEEPKAKGKAKAG